MPEWRLRPSYPTDRYAEVSPSAPPSGSRPGTHETPDAVGLTRVLVLWQVSVPVILLLPRTPGGAPLTEAFHLREGFPHGSDVGNRVL